MKSLYSRYEMEKMNIELLEERGVCVEQIAEIAYYQQKKYISEICMSSCIESVRKILSLRDVFHIVQLGIEIDKLTEQGHFKGPIYEILKNDLGVFGIDEVFGLQIAGLYGAIGMTNFGDIDVNKPGIVKELDSKGDQCNTMLDDIVGAIAAAASTRVAQVHNEKQANIDDSIEFLTLDL